MSILLRQLDFAPQLFAQALINSIWQGVLLASVIWLLLRLCVRKANAATRYSIWSATLIAVVCLPFLNAFNPSGTVGTATISSNNTLASEPSHTTPTSTRESLELSVMNTTDARQRPRGFESDEMVTASSNSQLTSATIHSPHGAVETATKSHTAREWSLFRLRDEGWSRLFLIFWMLGVAVMLARLMRSYLSLRRYKLTSKPLAQPYQERLDHWLRTCGIGRAVRLHSSGKIAVPLMLGLRTSVILFPEKLASELASDEFDQVLLHELAHARRRDDWTNLLQKLCEACFFFHPVVWWTGRQLNAEREMACDQWVVNVTGAHRSYASCLTRLFELTETPRAPLLAPGALRLKSHLARRVETILRNQRGLAPHFSLVRLIVPLCLLSAMLIQFARIPPVIAVSVSEGKEVYVAGQQETLKDVNAGATEAHQGFEMNVRDGDYLRGIDENSREGLHDENVRQAIPQLTSQLTSQQEASHQEGWQQNDASESLKLSVNQGGIPLQNTSFELAERTDNISTQFMRPVAFVSEGGKLQTEISNGATEAVKNQPRPAQGASGTAQTGSTGVSVPQEFFRTIAASDSAATQRELLTALLRTGEPARDILVQSLNVAKGMDSDGEKAEFLVYAARFCSSDAAVLNAYLSAVASIKSAGEQRRVLSTLLKLKGQDRVILSRALKTATVIDSDGEKAELLVMAARLYAIDNVSLAAFLNAVQTISSAGESRRALTAGLRQGKSGAEVLVQIVKFARHINSDGEKAEFLVRVSEVCPGSDALVAAYMATAATLNSAAEQRRALDAMSNMKKAVG